MLSESNLARLAQGSYENNDIARSYAKEIHPSFDIDTDLSTEYAKIYHSPELKKTIVSFRGTKLNDKKDLVADTMYFLNFGKKSNRFKDADETTKRVLEKYGRDGVETANHSLGANIGRDISKKYDLPTTNFNAGRKLLPSTKAKQETTIRNMFDPFSGTSVIASPISAPASLMIGGYGRLPNVLNPHSLQNF